MNKKEQIYKTALKLFNQYGFDRTPTSMIASEAGVATGTLFHYFPTKEELINSLYLNCKDSMLGCALEGAGNEKTYRGKFRRVCENILRWGVERRDEFLFFQQFSNSPSIRDNTRLEGEARFKAVSDIIAEGIEREHIKKIDSGILIQSLIGLLSANILYAMRHPSLLDNAGFMEDIFTLVWDAVRC